MQDSACAKSIEIARPDVMSSHMKRRDKSILSGLLQSFKNRFLTLNGLIMNK